MMPSNRLTLCCRLPSCLQSFPAFSLPKCLKVQVWRQIDLCLNPSFAAYCVTLGSSLHVLKPHLSSVNDKDSTSRAAVRITWLMFVDYVWHGAAVRKLYLLWSLPQPLLVFHAFELPLLLNTLPRWVSVKTWMPGQNALLHPRSTRAERAGHDFSWSKCSALCDGDWNLRLWPLYSFAAPV